MQPGEDWFFRKGWPDGTRLDSSEVPCDPALPHLSRLFDTEHMCGVFRRFPVQKRNARHLQVEGVQIASVSYRPGRECRVNYAIDFRNTRTGHQERVYAYAKTLSTRRNERMLDGRIAAATQRKVRFLRDDASQSIIAVFPNDIRVSGLRNFIAIRNFSDAAKAATNEFVLADRRDTGGRAPLEIVSYRPERYCLFKCWLKSAGAGTVPAYARMYRDERGARVYSLMERLWESPQRGSGALHVARPLGYSSVDQVLFQASLSSGRPGNEIKSESMADEPTRMGAALAALHAVAVSAEWGLVPDSSPAEKIRWLRKNVHGLTDINHAIAAPLAVAVDELEGTTHWVDSEPFALIHGDFSMKQVVVDSGSVGIIDFDDASWGNPYSDLGSFLARLRGAVDRGHVSPTAAQSFKLGYKANTGGKLDERQLAWFTALAFVRGGLGKLAHLLPDWPEQTRNAFSRARETLAAAR